jgi:hypothetical protein
MRLFGNIFDGFIKSRQHSSNTHVARFIKNEYRHINMSEYEITQRLNSGQSFTDIVK